uniref:Uncharacterized protein n=1 Tax=Anguilla anguilla TaxID=7936 RepID=A0A0E9PH54_ANGAN
MDPMVTYKLLLHIAYATQ